VSEQRRRRVPRWLLVVTTYAALLWGVSVLFAITRFGDVVTVTLQEGFIGVYWGGDAEHRNARVDNGFSAPWNPESGAGRSFPKRMTWAVSQTSDIIHPREWPRAIQYGTFFNRILGFWPPDASLRGDVKYVILPIWMAVVVALTGTGYAAWRNRRLCATGACRRCGYNLAGNVSGVCPECGEAAR